jgi:hypothetical protein
MPLRYGMHAVCIRPHTCSRLGVCDTGLWLASVASTAAIASHTERAASMSWLPASCTAMTVEMQLHLSKSQWNVNLLAEAWPLTGMLQLQGDQGPGLLHVAQLHAQHRETPSEVRSSLRIALLW